jgi:hypothetical protein
MIFLFLPVSGSEAFFFAKLCILLFIGSVPLAIQLGMKVCKKEFYPSYSCFPVLIMSSVKHVIHH